MRRPSTLRARLSLAALAVATVSIVVLTTVFNLLLVRRLNGQAENVLRARAVAAASTVTVRADGTIAFDDARDLDVNLTSGVWIFEGTRDLDAPPSSSALQAQARALAGTDHRLVHRDEPSPVALYSLGIKAHGKQVGTVVAAISLEAYRHSTQVTIVASVVLALVLLVVVYLLARTLVTRALTPVQEMTQQALAWSEAGTAERFGEAPRPGELALLAATLDDLLDRLSAVLRREQHLSAEISHELRTPLAGIVAETDLFAARPRSAEEAARAMDAVRAGARRMEGILETLLSAARAEAGTSLGRSDARAVVDEAVAALGSTRVRVALEIPRGVTVGLDQAVAERALAPLLANAVRHAASAVTVVLVADPSAVRLEVRDDGPGVPDDLVEEVFEPGRQVDPEHGGAGLGLALARRLARASGGDVVCVTGAGGRFVLTLPHG